MRAPFLHVESLDLDAEALKEAMVAHPKERAGAGIVADSNPDRQLAESRAKARGPLLALKS